MRPRSRAVATYLQTFILIAVALGGSIVAYNEVSAYANATGGPGISVSGASLRQEAGVALERLAISDSGTSYLAFVDILNPGLAADVRYCYTVASTSGSVISGTCPSTEVDPTRIRIPANLTSGSTVIVMVLLMGGSVVSPGVLYPVIVTAPGAGTPSQHVVADRG